MIDQQFIQLQSAKALDCKHFPVDPRIPHIGAYFHQCRHRTVGFRTGVIILKTAGIRCHAGIQAHCNAVRYLNRQHAAQAVEDLTHRRSRTVQQSCLGVGHVGYVVVNAEIYTAAILFLYPAAQQLGICHIYRNNALRRKVRCCGLFRQHELIPRRDLIIAEHCRTLSQLL